MRGCNGYRDVGGEVPRKIHGKGSIQVHGSFPANPEFEGRWVKVVVDTVHEHDLGRIVQLHGRSTHDPQEQVQFSLIQVAVPVAVHEVYHDPHCLIVLLHGHIRTQVHVVPVKEGYVHGHATRRGFFQVRRHFRRANNGNHGHIGLEVRIIEKNMEFPFEEAYLVIASWIRECPIAVSVRVVEGLHLRGRKRTAGCGFVDVAPYHSGVHWLKICVVVWIRHVEILVDHDHLFTDEGSEHEHDAVRTVKSRSVYAWATERELDGLEAGTELCEVRPHQLEGHGSIE